MPGYSRKGRKPNTYYVEFFDGIDYRGKPNRFTTTIEAKSPRELEKEMAKYYAECAAGNVRKSSTLKMGQLCDLYVKEYAEPTMKLSALNTVKAIIRRAVKPAFEDVKASSIAKIHIQAWVNDYQVGRSPKTVRNAYSVIHSIFSWANKMDILDKNPCKDIMLPKPRKQEANYYDKEAVTALLKALDTVPKSQQGYKVAVLILLFSGVRKGELFGLNRADVNLSTGEVQIQRTRQVNRVKKADRVADPVYEDIPKTFNSTRKLTLPAEVLEHIKQLLAYQDEMAAFYGAGWEGSESLLLGNRGQTMYPELLYRWFSAFLEKKGLKHISLHGLRHTHTAMLAYLNTDKMVISRHLGHSQLSTTLNIYTHLFEDKDTIAQDLSKKFLQSPS